MPLWYIGARQVVPRRCGDRAAPAQRGARRTRRSTRTACASAPRTTRQREQRSAALRARERCEAARRGVDHAGVSSPPACAGTSTTTPSCSTRASPTTRRSSTICAMTRPGSIFTSGGGSLGWNGGAAIGAKLAAPDKTVVAMTGDGSYMFSVPSSVHWMAAQYQRRSCRSSSTTAAGRRRASRRWPCIRTAIASRANDLDLAFDPPPDYAGIAAAAGGAHARAGRAAGGGRGGGGGGVPGGARGGPRRRARRLARAAMSARMCSRAPVARPGRG